MNRLIQRLASAAVATAAMVGASAMAQGKGESLKFQDYPGLGNLLTRVAISKGYCEKNGIKCELQVIPTSPLGAQALMAKSIEVAMLPMDAVNMAVQRGAKIKAVVGGQVNNIALLAFGNHMDAPNAGKPWPAYMQDLKGKKIGVPARGSTVEIFASWMLAKAGMDPEKDVTFVATGAVPTSYAALSTKQVDAVFSYDLMGPICDTLKTCKVQWRADTDTQPAEMFATNGGQVNLALLQDYIERNPHVVEAVIKSIKEADAFVNNPANFAETLAIAQKYFRLDSMPRGEEILAANLRHHLQANNFRAAINRKAVAANFEMTLSTRQVEKIMPLADMLYDKAP